MSPGGRPARDYDAERRRAELARKRWVDSRRKAQQRERLEARIRYEEPWKRQPPCKVCGEQHAGYEGAHG